MYIQIYEVSDWSELKVALISYQLLWLQKKLKPKKKLK